MMKKIICFFYIFISCSTIYSSNVLENNIVWSVGKADNSTSEFALSPNGYKNFVGSDFGYEDKFYLIGYSNEKKDFPYVIPGPVDTWGGTWYTSGWRTNQVNIMFGITKTSNNADYKLVINLVNFAK